MRGIITSIRLFTYDTQWAIVSIDHGTGIPDSQMTIPAKESGEWTLGETIDLMAHDAPTGTKTPYERASGLARN